MNSDKKNPYLPALARIVKITPETEGERAIKTFRAEIIDENADSFNFQPGQTIMVSVFGKGESMFAISTSPTRKNIEFSVMRVGRVTLKLHQLEEGSIIGIRGPYGRGFPVEDWYGKNILLIAGGIGMAPLRSVLHYVIDEREKFRDVTLIYGARTSKDLVYRNELETLQSDDINVWLSIDTEEEGWFKVNWDKPEETVFPPETRHFTGFVPMIVLAVKPEPENTVAIVCGPPVMIGFTVQNLEKLGFGDKQIYSTLENKMKCGIGKCGRCNIGSVYVCKDGPVFRYDEIRKLPSDF
jgi:NAD(P)H-flavin reductase